MMMRRRMLLLLVSVMASFDAFTTTTNAFVIPISTPAKRTTAGFSSSLRVAVDTSEIKNGMTIELDGEPYKVLNFSIMKQARGAAKTTIKMKNLMRSTTIENTYRSGEKFETAEISKTDAQFTYKEGINYFFMDTASYEEVAVSATVMGDVYQWIAEGTECKLVSFKGSVIEVIPPSPAVFTVVETEPNMKGNTSQGYTKPAVLDCGATISVPGFVEPGQKIRVDTEKGVYMERVN